MRWSQMHIPTLREDPAEADSPSHRLLLRAGYIRQLMAGHYSLLPLGQRVRLKVIGIIREEMDRTGAQEFLMPVMHPAELWVKSGRWELMGDELFRLKDRKGANIEKAASRLAAVDDSERAGLLAAPKPFATPGVLTIEDLAVHYQAPADRQIKTLVYFLDGVLTLVLMRGDHALNEQKLADATGAVAIRPAQPEEIRAALGALPGSLGAVGSASQDHPVIADEALRDETGRGRRGMFTGANTDDTH